MNTLLDRDTRLALEYSFLYLKDSVAFDIFISSLSIEQRGFNVRFRQAIFNKINNAVRFNIENTFANHSNVHNKPPKVYVKNSTIIIYFFLDLVNNYRHIKLIIF